MDAEGPPSLSAAQDKNDDAMALPSPAQTTEKPAKKPTRQWAAWTRQEEESFFSALRQVGKNFEKITSRVQSKNKDQVRHYYYRLVRRMKKLLGPGFGLDAKNSKDTIAAMLRWWSLLEKHRCTASKLHLKPRIFKTFIEALAHQLLKDRNKTRRKRSTNGDAFLPATPATSTVLGRGLSNDSRPVKLFLVDGQNNRKVGSKGTGVGPVGANDSYSRGSLTNLKTMKQRRKRGFVASTAYKRWEKAAMAGVTLVADAAECLERSTNDESIPFDQVTCNVLSGSQLDTNIQQNSCSVGIAAEPLPSVNLSGNCMQILGSTQPLSKLKLQLFPLDDFTRKVLEKDEYNPYLELALSRRKKITSVIDHLSRKWGRSNIACGDLTLFPYSTHPEDVSCSQRWTRKDTSVSADDVFVIIGSPLIFRLRYAWLSNSDSRIVQVPASYVHVDKISNVQVQTEVNASIGESEVNGRRKESPIMAAEFVALPNDNVDPIISSYDEPNRISIFPQGAVSQEILDEMDSGREQQDHKAESHAGNNTVLSAGDWADGLTNISVGDLLSEASRDAHCFRVGSVDNTVQLLPKMSLSCDSFDAVIAAHLDGFKNQEGLPPRGSHRSIWDAEETCDGFSFPMISSRDASGTGNSTMVGSIEHAVGVVSNGHLRVLEELEVEPAGNPSDGEEELNDVAQSNEHHTYENSLGLADISWPDSLGALELDIPTSSRYVNQDMFFGDCNSVDGLNRFTANSLDAFQSCLFFSSLDRKEIGGG